ncbi:MAG: acetyl-CoA carboxylase biotin carboxylase subunit [Deltaproteobacteria bacterium]|nr:acetyl-CoA carboxylase biotin carboxylase subunit [Deltaproteobacteria bacterium]
MFTKILIANRGEIAVRIMQTCRRMGIQTVAVYSEADFRSLHVVKADEAVPLGGARPAESYLNKEKILQVALDTGCQAIHPGYGFLSENADFADMVTAAGIVFIGPSGPVIARLGDKIASKKLAIQAGIPTVPGHVKALSSEAEAGAVAAEVGYPILLKPAAGGGGKGMRTVTRPEDLASALRLCRQETRKAFGDDAIFIERYIEAPRHIEIQVMADAHGHAISLGERECSIQRRYQKIIEESPSVALDTEARGRMGRMACRLALEAGYVNAGTVEFIFDADKQFYFLEMNTRLQVEHPVTEMVTGLDLVELQLRVANGEPLPLKQEDVRLKGWAFEARVCAEDTERNFVPSIGLITRYAEPAGSRIRVDSGVRAGSSVHVFYDSMLAKVITWGGDREQARLKMVDALNGYHIEGIKTNVDFANRVICHPSFIKGDLSTGFIARHLADAHPASLMPEADIHFMAIAATLIYHLRENLIHRSLLPLQAQVGGAIPAKRQFTYVTKSNGAVLDIEIEPQASQDQWRVRVNDAVYDTITPPMEYYRRRLKLTIGNATHYFRLHYSGNFIEVAFCGMVKPFEIYTPKEWQLARFMPKPAIKAMDNVLRCPMPGLMVAINVQAGDRVFKGQELLTIESMKMETAVASPVDGEVAAVQVTPGETVDTGSVLISFK